MSMHVCVLGSKSRCTRRCSVPLMLVLVLVLVLVTWPLGICALNNGLALKPQMGFNSWYTYNCHVNETLILDAAQALITTGLAAAGYTYVNIDDCWALPQRDSEGRQVADPAAFPSGLFALGQRIHALGLQYGIYSDAGIATCAGRPGSLHYEVIDALTFAAWGFDYLKYDNCYTDSTPPTQRYPNMSHALNATGRPMIYSMCDWGVEDPAKWGGPIANSWRTTWDVLPIWFNVSHNIEFNDPWWQLAGPGHWNDPDMLMVGLDGLTWDEAQTQFSLWCLVKSPLLIAADVRQLSQQAAIILLNSELIALNQDDLGVQGHRVTPEGDAEVFAGPLANGDIGVVLYNRGNYSNNVTVDFAAHLGLNQSTAVSIRDLVTHTELGVFKGGYSASLRMHATQTLRLTPRSPSVASSIGKQYELHPNMQALLHPSSDLWNRRTAGTAADE